jgi:hypothetical protein
MDDQSTNRERSKLAVKQFCALCCCLGMILVIVEGFTDRNYWKAGMGVIGLSFGAEYVRDAFKK